MPKKKKPATRKSATLRWEFDADIPTHDFFEGGSLDDIWNLQEAVDGFVFMLEQGDFLTWEAVMCEEQGLPLTAPQKKALSALISFNEPEDDEILYINEIPRPNEPWYVILNKIVPHLLIEPFRTFDLQEEMKCNGWQQIMEAVKEHGQGLSLPKGVQSPEEVVPAELRHKLSLQYCFDILSGLGQEEELTLTDGEQQDRILWFIERLRECKDSVAYFDLTLESLLTRVILPDKDKPIFTRVMHEKLGLGSSQEPITDRL